MLYINTRFTVTENNDTLLMLHNEKILLLNVESYFYRYNPIFKLNCENLQDTKLKLFEYT